MKYKMLMLLACLSSPAFSDDTSTAGNTITKNSAYSFSF